MFCSWFLKMVELIQTPNHEKFGIWLYLWELLQMKESN
ncbi:hypothetical protein LEP1GSC013_3316 [Leptospira interrogans serovar Valbuzzi str. Duyster]|nr:hypothetical protein LEP1GSC013_3316 [Leptospira interrogans serovar Valbuzzi str. Duyster]ENO72064.1 hypothetical protein LEP1GSC012_2255 [Leptospira interrogans serovar Valbuzzi str. Valbuzzi]